MISFDLLGKYHNSWQMAEAHVGVLAVAEEVCGGRGGEMGLGFTQIKEGKTAC